MSPRRCVLSSSGKSKSKAVVSISTTYDEGLWFNRHHDSIRYGPTVQQPTRTTMSSRGGAPVLCAWQVGILDDVSRFRGESTRAHLRPLGCVKSDVFGSVKIVGRSLVGLCAVVHLGLKLTSPRPQIRDSLMITVRSLGLLLQATNIRSVIR